MPRHDTLSPGMTLHSSLIALVFVGTTWLLPAQTIVTFGDSTTAPRGQTVIYSKLLGEELLFEGKAVHVVNAGIGGNTTKMAKARFEKDVIEVKPDVVIIQFGINDSAVDVWAKTPATKPRVALTDYKANLTAMVQTLKQRGTRVVLMTSNAMNWTPALQKMYGKPPYLPDDPDGLNVVLRDYVQAMREIAKAESVGLVDVYEAFQVQTRQPKKKPKMLCKDGMHPDDEGHRIVANGIIAHLAEADKRFTRRPNTVWKPSGEINSINPFATEISHDTPGPAVLGPALVKLGDGAVMSVFSTPTSYAGKPGQCYIAGRTTRDGGKTWEPLRELTRLPDGRSSHPTVQRMRDGSIHLFFLGYIKFAFKDGSPTSECRSDLWTSRSTDDGKTWSVPQMIYQGYTGSTNGAAETRSGNIVVPFSHYVSNPGHLVSMAVVSSDGGKTWKPSNELDIGGAGDHDGALEPCVMELKDGRVWMLIRTTKGRFWESFSTDGGLVWSAPQASSIDSAMAPGHLARLADGRLALAWNRPHGQRSELHVALSNDDGKTWSPSLVVVRGYATYPFILEPNPGDLWVGFIDAHDGWGTTPRACHLRIAEKTLLEESSSN